MTDTSSRLAGSSKLVLAGGALGFNWLPVFVAKKLGIFERHGLDVELRRMGSVDKATAAVLAGEADLAITPPEGAIANAIGGGGLYRGKYQCSMSTWASVGGTGDPATASETEQDKRASMLYERTGASSWPVCGR